MELQKPLELVFSFNPLNYLQYRVYNVLLWFALNESRSSLFNSTHFIKLPLVKNKIHINSYNTNDAYLRDIIIGISKHQCSYGIFNPKESVSNPVNKSLFSKLSIENNIVIYSIDDSFEEFFNSSLNLLTLHLEDTLLLRSKYSLKLYELAHALLFLGIYSIPLDIFRKIMGIVDEYSDISSFRKRVLNVAQKEICQHTDFMIGYYINIKTNIVFVYPQNKNDISNACEYMNTLFNNSYLLHKNEMYLYKNSHLDESSCMFCLSLVSVAKQSELTISKSSIQELKLFIQKNITIDFN